jgi:predicted DNA-binding transcriptional regulator AlpA
VQPVPTVKELAQNPARARGLSPTVIAALLAKFGADLAELSAAQNALAAALADGGMDCPRGSISEPEVLLTVEQTAERLNMTKDALYRAAKTLPFAVRLGPGQLRFSSAGIDQWIRAKTCKPTG